jgi:DNA-binding MurR/RpiR family transcriptional regulator
MSILITLKSIFDQLPNVEQQVADYILKHSDRVPYESVSQIAKNVNVSVPSVTRLTKKIGFKNFKDFKVELAVSGAQTSFITDVFSQIEKTDSDDEMTEKIFMGNIKSLEDTLKILDKKQISEFAKQCASTGRIVFIGQGGSGVLGHEAALRFAHIDIQAESYNDDIEVLLQTARLKKKQVCIGISHSGRTAIVKEGLRIAKERGAVTALITNYMNTPLKDLCDYLFFTSFVENSVRSAAISSKIAQTAIIDTLYLLTAKKKRAVWNFAELDTLIERSLKTK